MRRWFLMQAEVDFEAFPLRDALGLDDHILVNFTDNTLRHRSQEDQHQTRHPPAGATQDKRHSVGLGEIRTHSECSMQSCREKIEDNHQQLYRTIPSLQ
jgi:hypothetical protein